MIWNYKRGKYRRGPLAEFMGFFVFLFFAVWAVLGSIVIAMIGRGD